MSLEIKTDNKRKPFKWIEEVPKSVLKEQFDGIDENERDNYKGHWYHLGDFLRISSQDLFPGDWDAYESDSYFSGVLIKLSDDGQEYIAGTYFS